MVVGTRGQSREWGKGSPRLCSCLVPISLKPSPKVSHEEGSTSPRVPTPLCSAHRFQPFLLGPLGPIVCEMRGIH